MKFTSIALFSVLSLCAAVNGKAIDEQEIKTISTSVDEVEQLKPIEPAIIVPCSLEYGMPIPEIHECQDLNGKVYQKFNPYPKCSADYVCLIPATEEDDIKNCVIVESKIYCSSNFTNIEACQSENKDYDFRQCVGEVGELISNFKYSFISKPTIMPPPPSSTKTRIPLNPNFSSKPTIMLPPPSTKTRVTLNPTFISKPTRTIIRPTPIIRRPTKSLVPKTDQIDLPTKTRVVSEPIPIMKPFPTVRPSVRPTLHPIIIDDEKE